MNVWMALTMLACSGSKDDVTADSGVPGALVACDACGGVCGTDEVPALSRQHVESDVAYLASPPAGGDHDACWAPWSASADALRPENWVHNLEHGGIVLLYPPDASAEDIAALTGFLDAHPAGRVVVTPYSAAMDLEGARFAAVAWEHRLMLGCVDLDAMGAFYDTWSGRGPEDTMSAPSEACMGD